MGSALLRGEAIGRRELMAGVSPPYQTRPERGSWVPGRYRGGGGPPMPAGRQTSSRWGYKVTKVPRRVRIGVCTEHVAPSLRLRC